LLLGLGVAVHSSLFLSSQYLGGVGSTGLGLHFSSNTHSSPPGAKVAEHSSYVLSSQGIGLGGGFIQP
jgi:hypothetical protein